MFNLPQAPAPVPASAVPAQGVPATAPAPAAAQAPQAPAAQAPAQAPAAPARLQGSIMDFFTGNGGVGRTPAQYVQQAPGQLASQPQQPATPAAPASPLESYAKLFDTAKDDKHVDPQAQLTAPLFALDAAKLQEAVAKRDFVGNINPELHQRALQGDAQALSQILNTQAQQVYAQSVMVMQQMIEQGFNTYNNRLHGALPSTFKNLATQQELAHISPAAQHAAVAPLLQSLQQQFITANPQATPQQIAQQMQSYLQAVASTVAPPAPVRPADPVNGSPLMQQQGGAPDWASYFMQ